MSRIQGAVGGLLLMGSVVAAPEYLNSGAVLPTDLPFSEAVRVGDTVYLSGQIGVKPGTLELVAGGIEAETRQTMENIRITLEAHGLGLENLVKCVVMLEDIGEWGTFNGVYRTYFEAGRYPARSALGADGLALGARVEVECIAVVPEAPAAAAVPFALPVPEGWGTETIPFPLGFAPSLAHEGLEELRFAPGMFEAEAEDFWSYAFVWWIESAEGLDAERLKTELAAYFTGLSQAVAATREIDPAAVAPTTVNLQGVGVGTMEGTIRTFDSFTTQAPISLHASIHQWSCEDQGHDVVFFALSPQPLQHPIWRELTALRLGFSCTR